MILGKEGLIEYIERDEKHSKVKKDNEKNYYLKSRQALPSIMLSTRDFNKIKLRNCKTARVSWLILEKTYEILGIKKKHQIELNLQVIKYNEEEDLGIHITSFQSLINQLEASGDILSNDRKVTLFLHTLPE